MSSLHLRPKEAGVLIVDWQERLAAAMPEAVHAVYLRNACNLVRGARLFDIPTLMTLQYPKGLGPAVGPILEALDTSEAGSALAAPPIEKRVFSVMGVEAARKALQNTGRRAWVLCGMETHVCIFQTVRDMVEAGYEVWLPADTLVSRRRGNWETGIELCRKAGATITSTEAILFDWCGAGQGEQFKAISKMVK